MKNTFGKRVRSSREDMLQLDPMFGLRQVAARVGIEPSYLSKIERGLVSPPSDATIVRLAKSVLTDPDELLALAGRISEDIRRTILKRPKLMARLIRQFAKVSDKGVERVIIRARRTGRQ